MKKPVRKMFSTVAATVAFSLSQPVTALNIALTNDDGWSTYGIHALFNALTDAGHTVTLAGPQSGESGSSAAIDVEAILDSALTITKRADNIYSVATPDGSAEPATSGAIATNLSLQTNASQPDLLLSGINDGANVGPAAQISGTVGAAIVSIGRVVGESIPAIAVSTDERCEFEEPETAVVPDPEDIPDDCKEIANFIVELIDELERKPHHRHGRSGLLPAGLALNINYPPQAPLGIKLARQGKLPFIAQLGGAAALEIACYGNCVDMAVGSSSPGGFAGVTPLTEDDIRKSDSALFAEGYITIVPIEADYTASSRATGSLYGTLHRFIRRH